MATVTMLCDLLQLPNSARGRTSGHPLDRSLLLLADLSGPFRLLLSPGWLGILWVPVEFSQVANRL